jgi:hypothetical protein
LPSPDASAAVWVAPSPGVLEHPHADNTTRQPRTPARRPPRKVSRLRPTASGRELSTTCSRCESLLRFLFAMWVDVQSSSTRKRVSVPCRFVGRTPTSSSAGGCAVGARTSSRTYRRLSAKRSPGDRSALSAA